MVAMGMTSEAMAEGQQLSQQQEEKLTHRRLDYINIDLTPIFYGLPVLGAMAGMILQRIAQTFGPAMASTMADGIRESSPEMLIDPRDPTEQNPLLNSNTVDLKHKFRLRRL